MASGGRKRSEGIMASVMITSLLLCVLPGQKKVRCYDFDFSHWPSDFSWTEVSNP